MIAQVVPITRLRRATTWWSYTLSPSQHCQPGSLVIVPFRGHPTLGIIWHIEKEDSKATASISEVLTANPLIRAAQRSVIEYLSQIGLCSLSTALYQWLPTELRTFPMNSKVRQLLKGFNTWQPTTGQSQHAILVPSRRLPAEEELQKKYKETFRSLFQNERSIEDWFAIAQGVVKVGIGREKALMAPWLNLRSLTIIEPEDISYYHDQIPYCSLLLPAQELSKFTQAKLQYRSFLPNIIAQQLWPNAQGTDHPLPPIEWLDLKVERLLGSSLIKAIQRTLQNKQEVVILYNAHDRLTPTADATKKLQPGLESVTKQLSHLLGQESLPESIHIGTRALFQSTYQRVGLTVVLSLDPLLNQTNFADILHGIGDLGHLFEYQVPTIIQTAHLEHPLVQDLRNHSLTNYPTKLIQEQAQLHLSPFGQYLLCSITDHHPEVMKVYEKIQALITPPWHCSYPYTHTLKGKEVYTIMLHTPDLNVRLDASLRTLLSALPRPWKIQYNPPHGS